VPPAPLAQIDAEEAERKADDLFRTLGKVARELDKGGDSRAIPKRAAQTITTEIKQFLDEQIPLMLLLCTPGLKDRHWQEIMNITGLVIPVHEGSNLSQMMDLSLHTYVASIEETCVAASKEYGLEKAMDKMEKEWESMKFECKPHRNTGTCILSAIDEIQQLLDDHIVKTQAMRGNRYITPFLDRITAWEKLLVGLQDIIDNWLKMQATWLYLEPIFSSDDIMRQMPTEGRLFRSVDNTYRYEKRPMGCPHSLSLTLCPLGCQGLHGPDGSRAAGLVSGPSARAA
jgi:dynein heavy chain, axonemal